MNADSADTLSSVPPPRKDLCVACCLEARTSFSLCTRCRADWGSESFSDLGAWLLARREQMTQRPVEAMNALTPLASRSFCVRGTAWLGVFGAHTVGHHALTDGDRITLVYASDVPHAAPPMVTARLPGSHFSISGAPGSLVLWMVTP